MSELSCYWDSPDASGRVTTRWGPAKANVGPRAHPQPSYSDDTYRNKRVSRTIATCTPRRLESADIPSDAGEVAYPYRKRN